VRRSPHDQLTVYAESIYSVDDLPGAIPKTTANENKGGLRFDRDFTSRLFVFVNADFMSDGLQDLNLRSVLGGGIGYRLIRSERTTLDLFVGPNFTRENYVEFQRNFAAAQAKQEFMHKFGQSTTVRQSASFFPQVGEGGASGINYRANFTFETVTRLNKWLGWQNNFSNDYVTNPPAGKKKNELVFTSGLNIAFRP
jgi:putative salt-induced outer membrane protein YdiY